MARTPDTPLTIAIRLLSRREHTAQELREKLAQREISGADCDAVLARLQETDLQSDRRFCAAYLRQKHSAFGDYRLRAELAKRGVAKAEIAAALAAAELPPEAERARAVLRRKYARGITAEEEAQARRFLHSRGFSGESIRAAIAQANADE